MKVLHTSDWHLGRTLCTRKRHEECAQWLEWLARTIARERVDVLLIAGDVFDTSTPGNRAQALYYRFLHRIASLPGLPCRHVMVIAGNHDSPTFLDAPAELLSALGVHVIGQARADVAEEVLLLRDGDGAAQAIVCAVPYLRERDLRTAEAGESLEEKERKLRAGLRAHYAAVARAAQAQRARIHEAGGRHLPIIAMGHLYAEGAGIGAREGEGVRDLYVGGLGHIDATAFSPVFDYVALGHLHLAQTVGGARHIRYSGAPLAMGFGELGQRKSVTLVEWPETELAAPSTPMPQPHITELPVPVFQPMARLEGDWETLSQALARLKSEAANANPNADVPIWLEIVYAGSQPMPDLQPRLHALVADAPLDILRIRNRRLSAQALQAAGGLGLDDEALAALDSLIDAAATDAQGVFQRCLDAHDIPAEQRPALQQAYAEILLGLQEEDRWEEG